MRKILYKAIGYIEIGIGTISLIGCSAVQYLDIRDIPKKPENVYFFVVITAVSAIVLGAGLLMGKEWARRLLIFFAGYVVLTKLLVYLGLMSLSGPVVTFLPRSAVDIISSVYHLALIALLIIPTKK